MTELNLHCHYQMVRCKTQYGYEFTVHEAYSQDKGGLYMVNPVPVYVVGESKEEVSELTSMIEKDIERYSMVEMDEIQPKFDKYLEYTTFPVFEPEEKEEDKSLEEELIDTDYHDDSGKVLDLVDFMKKKR